MTAFNFQPRFAGLVESGQKTQTIRKTLRGKVGENVYLYTGQRTKQCRKLGEGVIRVAPKSFNLIRDPASGAITVLIATLPLGIYWHDDFARRDGFKDMAGMVDWFEKQHGLPFNGWLIRWRLNKC